MKMFVMTLSKFVAIEFKNELKEQVATEDCMLRQRPVTKIENFVVTELSIS